MSVKSSGIIALVLVNIQFNYRVGLPALRDPSLGIYYCNGTLISSN
jgi:hypothetical protein